MAGESTKARKAHDLTSRRFVAALLFIGLLFTLPAWAQFDTGTIIGTTTDPSGAVNCFLG
jgi:hypothetical protein